MQALKLSLVFLFIGLYSLAQTKKNNVISSESTTETFTIKTDQGVYHFASLKHSLYQDFTNLWPFPLVENMVFSQLKNRGFWREIFIFRAVFCIISS